MSVPYLDVRRRLLEERLRDTRNEVDRLKSEARHASDAMSNNYTQALIRAEKAAGWAQQALTDFERALMRMSF